MHAPAIPIASAQSALPCWVKPATLTGLIHLALLLVYVLLFKGQVSCLVCANGEMVGHTPFEEVNVGFATGGFDGQYYYVLARDPWHRNTACLDLPAYRHARILYPALAWTLSLGNPDALLWVLPAINLLAIAALGGVGAAIAAHYKRSPYWGIALALALNVGAAALRDLTEPLALLTAAGLLLAWLKRAPCWQMALWGSAAVFAREQNLLIVAVVLGDALLHRSWKSAATLVGVGCMWGGWACLLHSIYGAWPVSESNLSAPFVGLTHLFTHLEGRPGSLLLCLELFGILVLGVQMTYSVVLPFCRAERVPLALALAGFTLASLGGVVIYSHQQSFTRVFFFMPLGIWLWCMQSGRRWPALLLALAGGFACVEMIHAHKAVLAGVITFVE